MRAITLGPDDPVVLMRAGWSLCFVGYHDEGIRYTETAVIKAPGSGNTHHYHGMSNFVSNRLDAALSKFETAERLMPGGHINWTMKLQASHVKMSRDCWAEAETDIDRCSVLIPAYSYARVIKAIICLRQGRASEAQQQIRDARLLGAELPSILWFDRVLAAKLPGYERRNSDISALWAATEPNV